ncbi:MAG TPA: hypothetical protein VKU41_15000 [Polyangiaceae bacterium]|nr:hypothetical protein [Polyangiaceae bacterium]
MQTPSPKLMAAARAGEVLREHLDGRAPLTVADAAAKSGLALRDAESGLTWLSKEYRGQLRVTADGDLVHIFPTGFSKPWETRDAIARAAGAVGHAAMGVVRFVVRAWVTIVLVGYAAVFVALILGLAFARQGNDDRRGNDLPGGAIAYAFFRVLGDALFWTFHPWSPFAVAPMWEGPAYRPARRARSDGVPLYERVNRFFFGPTPAPEDPRAEEQRVLAAIRAGKGRIGLADVMRVTGLPRERADPLMAKLMLDYDGDVAVSEEGGIVYRFPAIRRTAEAVSDTRPPPPAWTRAKPLPPLTGNSPGANLGIGALNAFNLFVSLWALTNDMTIERVVHLFDRIPHPIADTGIPIALGIVPFVFSLVLFVVPAARALARPARERRAAEERGRLAVLREVVDRVAAKQPVTDQAVKEAWRQGAGRVPDPKRVDRELVALGGDVAIDDAGRTRWRFVDLETEAAAVAAEREAASDEEARLGKVVFATDDRTH